MLLYWLYRFSMSKTDANLCIKHIPFDRKIYINCGWKKTRVVLKAFFDLCGKFSVKDMISCFITSPIIPRFRVSVKTAKQISSHRAWWVWQLGYLNQWWIQANHGRQVWLRENNEVTCVPIFCTISSTEIPMWPSAIPLTAFDFCFPIKMFGLHAGCVPFSYNIWYMDSIFQAEWNEFVI